MNLSPGNRHLVTGIINCSPLLHIFNLSFLSPTIQTISSHSKTVVESGFRMRLPSRSIPTTTPLVISRMPEALMVLPRNAVCSSTIILFNVISSFPSCAGSSSSSQYRAELFQLHIGAYYGYLIERIQNIGTGRRSNGNGTAFNISDVDAKVLAPGQLLQ